VPLQLFRSLTLEKEALGISHLQGTRDLGVIERGNDSAYIANLSRTCSFACHTAATSSGSLLSVLSNYTTKIPSAPCYRYISDMLQRYSSESGYFSAVVCSVMYGILNTCVNVSQALSARGIGRERIPNSSFSSAFSSLSSAVSGDSESSAPLPVREGNQKLPSHCYMNSINCGLPWTF
jgi:hypothetical protein